ncbi:MAG: DegT/DnrJ/EryC1/StrS family aminotransferase [Rhizobiaceae bacterium]|nr:DegT/DnrJ/EryC1/StrS family aminotransferase [Rhizobiaceae bacterium]MCV0408122.1 DegT/DnrJ/EryC1/StrS family aminotransferase [Rhizobiaceae bacterium]
MSPAPLPVRPETARPRFPFVKPRYPASDAIERHFRPAREAGFFTNFGPVSSRLERELGTRLLSGRSAMMCSSCTTALSVALLALDVSSPVLVPAFTFPATAGAVTGAGLTVLVGDVDPDTGILLEGEVRRAARQGCGAVIAVRPYGIWSDLSPLAAACREAGLPLVIDNAAGLGVGGDIVSRFGVEDAIEAFSLHATKPFGVGEGGVLAVPPEPEAPGLEAKLRSAMNFGLPLADGRLRGKGINGKMDEMTAAVGHAVLEELPSRVARRQEVAGYYAGRAGEAGLATFFRAAEHSTWQCFPVLLPDGVAADGIVKACAEEGLIARRYYHPALGEAGTPNARRLAARAVCLPVYDDAADAPEIWDIFSRAVAAA